MYNCRGLNDFEMIKEKGKTTRGGSPHSKLYRKTYYPYGRCRREEVPQSRSLSRGYSTGSLLRGKEGKRTSQGEK